MSEHSAALKHLSKAGVSIWLDDLSRERLNTGSLAADVAENHIVGVTSNPSIFAKSIGDPDTTDYDRQLEDLREREVTVGEAVRMMTTADVRGACDVLGETYERTSGVDGRVSIEVSPFYARDTAKTIAEARQLHWLVDRPNVLIKIPATKEGLPAIRAVLGQGISVNVTLIFSPERYKEVLEAFLLGLEDAKANGLDLSLIESVASFFISRIDTEVDNRLGENGPNAELRGTAGIASGRLAYEHFDEVMGSDRWKALADEGAHPQRLLWASTGVKNPDYPATMYVDELVTEDVVNTMPQATIDAVAAAGQDHFSDTIKGTYESAHAVMSGLADAGVDMAEVTQLLEDQGVKSFADAWQGLLDGVEESLKG
ncbi:transaldolase [Demequina aurantiaca]|uniref:transaldolase n=1 Tax=Demequina aurantiaca TaxID=676200 RepID=UPI0007802A85|nr:transaldolase [Demequina aurantiaca]